MKNALAQNDGLFISSHVRRIPSFGGKNITVPVNAPKFAEYQKYSAKHTLTLDAQKNLEIILVLLLVT